MTVPPEQQCTLPSCTNGAIDPSSPVSVCEQHLEAVQNDCPKAIQEDDHEDTDEGTREPTPDPTPEQAVDTTIPDTPYAEWQQPDSILFPASMQAHDAWIPWTWIERNGKETKQPWAPYSDAENAYSWSNPENLTDFESVQEWATMHPQLAGSAFILQDSEGCYTGEGDSYLFVDYDDVLEEREEPTPFVKALMGWLGETYTDVSTSGTGAHQIFRGELPEGITTITFDLPDGSGSVEIYDQRRVCIMTGRHVPGTPETAEHVDADVVEFLAWASETKKRSKGTREEIEPTYESETLDSMDTTDDIQAIFDAVRRLGPRNIRLYSSLTEETNDGRYSWDPSWEHSESGTRLGYDDDVGWIYRKGSRGLDALQVVALEERIISSVNDYPSGEDFWEAIEALRDRGAHIPELEQGDEDGDVPAEAVSTLPLAQLDALDHDERRRFAKKRGLEWPTTDEARERLFETIGDVMRNEDDRVIDAPTAMGKSHTIASTRWGAYDHLTGGKSVVHLSETRDARDEAISTAQSEGGEHLVLRSRDEACPVAAGAHDPEAADGSDVQTITIGGVPASQWLDAMCEGKSIPFSSAHRYLEEYNDQDVELPCTEGGEECDAIEQWVRLREGDHPLIIGTHQFAHVPGLRMATNLVFDEEPDFVEDRLGQDRIRRAITAYLSECGAELNTFEQLLDVAENGLRPNEHDQRDFEQRWTDLHAALDSGADREWYFECEDAHTLAPALAKAILNAEDRGNGRRAATVPHDPPRLDAKAHEEDGWNRSWVSVVLDEDNTVRTVRVAPDLSLARSVIGLDAHPSMPIWMRNTLPHIKPKNVLEPEERQLWRRYERGLRVVQVGDATRPLASGQYFNDRQVRVLLEHLRDEYDFDFRTAITSKSVENRLENLMHEAGIADPDTMHFGEEKSRNDFDGEGIGLVNGCIDPGDDFVLDLLAELKCDARPEVTTDGSGDEHRARGRGFVGPDADIAEEILASVRENHTAQAAGRYARDADDPSSTATVFVRTDAMPAAFADVRVPGVSWVYTDTQAEIARALRESSQSQTTAEIASDVGCSKEHVRQTLERLTNLGAVSATPRAGDHGATLYADTGLPDSGVCDCQEISNDKVWGSYTWALAITDPILADRPYASITGPSAQGVEATWDWRDASSVDDPPP